LLTGLLPSWRERGWRHWKIYDVTDDDVHSPNSLWVRLGWAKPAKPVAEGDYDEKTAISMYIVIGLAFLAFGLAGIFWLTVVGIRG
jgi:hypothetical protein